MPVIARVVAPALAPLPKLTSTGLGSLTGDVPFGLDDVRRALPDLTWAMPDEGHIVAAFDGKPAIIVTGDRFVEAIEVRTSKIETEIAARIGSSIDKVRARLELSSCGPYNPGPGACPGAGGSNLKGLPQEIACDLHELPSQIVLFDGPVTAAEFWSHLELLDGRHVAALRLSVTPSKAMLDRLARHPAPPAADPAIARLAVRIDRRGIHPISDAAKLSVTALGKLVPGLEVTENPPGTLVAARAGVPVLRVLLDGNRPSVVTALHPSLRNTLPIAIGQSFAEAFPNDSFYRVSPRVGVDPTLECGADDLDAKQGFCYFDFAPRIALRVSAVEPMMKVAVHSDGIATFANDAMVDAIEWTAPARITAWPIVTNDGVGPVTASMMEHNDLVRIRRALPAFDLKPWPQFPDSQAFQLRYQGRPVLTYDDLQGTATFDPRIKLAGVVGVGTTIAEARAKLGEIRCRAEYGVDPPEPQDTICVPVGVPHIAIRLGPARSFDDRKITSYVWMAHADSRSQGIQ